MGNSQSGELTLEEEPRKKKHQDKKKKKKRQDRKDEKRGEQESKLIENDDEKGYSDGRNQDKVAPVEMRFEHYSFPFENLVFEGGGNRCLAHCGAVKVLEEAGIMKHIRRMAGSGTGALVAALFCVGYSSQQVQDFLGQDALRMLNDRCCGYASLMPNLMSTLGWSSGKKLLKWLKERMNDATGRPEITFRQVHKSFNRELCIVAMNLSQGTIEYFHPKTTPHMQVAVAVRMSMSTPGLSKPIWHQKGDEMEAFMGGELVCNFPLHSFDGWWLSLKPDDNFLQKLNPLKHLPRLLDTEERFAGVNSSTIGVMLYSDLDQDIFSSLLEQRNRHRPAKAEKTELRVQYDRQQASKHLPSERFTTFAVALDYFMEAIRENDLDKGRYLSRKDLQNIINKRGCLTDKDLEALFGDRRITADDIFKQMQALQSDQISIEEMINHFDRSGLQLQERYLTHRRRHNRNLDEHFGNLTATLANHCRSAYLKKSDMERTIGVNCHHIHSSDRKLEQADQTFLVEQGVLATKAFLQYFLTKRTLPVHLPDVEDRCSFTREDLQQYIDDELSEIIDVGDYSENHITKVT